jgi:Plasmid pRiA4b ORF-3-like protein
MPSNSQPTALRVELKDIEPLIWRRIVVSNQWTFATLHSYLQWVMGWQDSHAHEFRVSERCIAPDWWIQEIGLDGGAASYQDERRISIASVARELNTGGEFEYHYDMGDGWVHRIVIETAPAAWSELGLRTPACTAGENACPPEDVGGPHGYKHFLECIADRAHPEYGDTLRWAGGAFDPRGFDLNRLNRDWKPGRRSTR